jgi:hypothetical protein
MRAVFCSLFSCVAVFWLVAVLRVLIVQPSGPTNHIADVNSGDHVYTGTEKSLDALKKIHLPKLESWQDRENALSETRYHLSVDRHKRITPVQLALSPNMISTESRNSDGSLLADFSASTNEEFDVMPLTGIKVPKFWKPPAGKSLIALESKIGDDETIFLMIARQNSLLLYVY